MCTVLYIFVIIKQVLRSRNRAFQKPLGDIQLLQCDLFFNAMNGCINRLVISLTFKKINLRKIYCQH